MISSSKFLKSCTAFGRLSIARVCGLCSLCFGLAVSASAQLTSSESAWLHAISQDADSIPHILALMNNDVSRSDILNAVQSGFTSANLKLELANTYLSLLDIALGHVYSDTTAIRSVLSTLNTTSTASNAELEDQTYYLRQILDELRQQSSNPPTAGSGFQDVLAGNPWWATNSAFALTKYDYDSAYPDEYPNLTSTFSFPQFASKWSSILTLPWKTAYINPTQFSQEWYDGPQSFGLPRILLGGYGRPTSSNPYTWYDWMSDAMRSNITLVSTMANSSTSELVSDSAAADQDVEDYIDDEDIDTTPEAIPDFEIERPADLTGYSDVSDSMSDVLSSFQNKINTNPGSHSSEITVIPEFTVGGIHVDEYKGDLNESGIAAIAHGVMAFVWTMMGICFTFQLLSREWAFYTSLGRSVH